MNTRSCTFLLSGLLLGLGLACGGSKSSAPVTQTAAAAKGLAYTNPAGSDWRFVKDTTSTSTRIVLNLVGPSGTKSRGVGFDLQAPSTVKFGTFSNGLPIADGGVYELLSSAKDPSEPVALIGGLLTGNVLTAGVYQKDRTWTAKDSGSVLCQVVLTFDATAGLKSGDPLVLSVPKAKFIPEDIGTATDDSWTLHKKCQMTSISIAVGTLTAQ